MARRDVDLVIRAKDEAEKVIESITKALNDFTDAQAALDSRAQKSESSLGKLGAAVALVDKAFDKFAAGQGIEKQFERSFAAIDKFKTGIAGTEKELRDLQKSTSATSDVVAKYTQRLEKAEQAQRGQSAAVGVAKKSASELQKSYDDTVKAISKMETRFAKLPALIDKQSLAVGKAAGNFNLYAQEMSETTAPSKTLVANFERTNRVLGEKRAKLQALDGELTELRGQLNAAGSAAVFFGQQSEKANADLARQEGILERTGKSVADLTQNKKNAQSVERSYSDQLGKTEASLASQRVGLERSEKALIETTQAARQFQQVLAESGQVSRSNLEQQLIEQGLAAQRAKQEIAEYQAELAQLRASTAQIGPPTREMSAAIGLAAQKADEAQFNFLLQEETLDRMGRSFREAGTDIASITNVQARFIAEQNKLSAAMTEVSNDGLRQRNVIRGLHQETERAGANQARMAAALRGTAAATGTAATNTSRLAQAYRQLYGDSRKALSIQQRLRGEVLSLVAAYGGLYGVINLLGQVLTATQTLEGATARLNVANDGDFNQTAADMDFLRRNANRLGVEIGVLATEYSKFSIATQGTALAGENTRKIFLAVAEAARVNRSSTEEMQGVFTALTQIVSKGAVQMEELRQQLGDRLPGALQLMADGLQVTTAELIKMMEQGEVGAEALVPFAEELQKRFGPGLSESLKGTSAQLGRLKNAAFEALVQFGRGGFIDSFNELARDLVTLLRSADFGAFLSSASAAMGGLLDVLGFLVRNFDLLVAAAGAFVGIKLTPFVLALGEGFRKIQVEAVKSVASLRAYSATATTAGAASRAASVSVGVLAGAFRALFSATGVGLLITAVSAGMALWATKANEATEALSQHREIVDKVKNAYDAVGGSVEEWRSKVADLTVEEAEANIRRLDLALQDLKAEADSVANNDGSFLTNFFGNNLAALDIAEEYKSAIKSVFDEFDRNGGTTEELVRKLSEVNQAYGDGSADANEYAVSVIEIGRRVGEMAEALEEGKDQFTALVDSSEEGQEAFDRLGNTAKDASEDIETLSEKTAKFNDAMNELKDKVPELAAELKLLGEIDAIDKLAASAIAAASSMTEVEAALRLAAQAKDELNSKFTADLTSGLAPGDTGAEAAAALLRGFEGFRATPYFDVNAQRVGYGSDTITLADGSIQKVVKGMRVSVEDANRDLLRRVTTEFLPKARSQTGAERFDTFSPQQQAVLTSISYNYGELPDRIIAAVRTGSDAEIATAIRGLAGDNEGVNRGRRNKEAALFESGAGEADQIKRMQKAEEDRVKAAEKLSEEQAKQLEKQNEFREGLADENETRRQAAALENESLIKQEQAKAVREAELEAKKLGITLTKEEIAAINESVAAKFASKQEEEGIAAAKQRAAAADERVNALLAQRRALDQNLEQAQAQGDTEKATELQEKLAEVNAELATAIESAKAMWEAIGGDAAATAITKLDTAALKADTLQQKAQTNYLQWDRVGDLFVNGLTNAFDRFAQSVAEGKSIGESARLAFLQFAADFLREIATMILKQAIFNALKAAFGGTGFGSVIGIGAGHTGGLVGSKRVGGGNQTRNVNPAAFAGAMRYHEGGLAGLRPGEVPIIAKQNEEILTRDDPRHMMNGGGGAQGSKARDVKIINAFDAQGFLEAALASEQGREVMLNFVSANKETMRSSMEG